MASEKITNGFQRIATEAKVDGWTMKHLRNVGSSLGRLHKRPEDERQAFLGHAVNGTSRFYEDDVDATYLLPLVNLVGTEYFDGEALSA